MRLPKRLDKRKDECIPIIMNVGLFESVINNRLFILRCINRYIAKLSLVSL